MSLIILLHNVASVLKTGNPKLKDVTILCIELGSVKVREEVKKVQVVDE